MTWTGEPSCSSARELLEAKNAVTAIDDLRDQLRTGAVSLEVCRRLGEYSRSLGDCELARQCYSLAIDCAPAEEVPRSCLQLGSLLCEMSRAPEAVEHLLRAVAEGGLSGPEYLTAGAGLARAGEDRKAIVALARSLEREQSARAWTELGACLFRINDIASAEACYREALICDPGYAAAHANLGIVLLYLGRYAEGFREYDWRTETQSYYRIEGFQAPRWHGEPLAGKTILLHAEQGLGDTIQFLRFVPMVAAQGARVLLVVQSRLNELAAGYPGVSRCLHVGEQAPPADFHSPLMSLPLVLGASLETIPAVDPAAFAGYVAPLDPSPPSGRLQVGLVWAGSPAHPADKHRSIPLSSFYKLAKIQHRVSFVSLQHGPATGDLANRTMPLVIRDACSGDKNFADSARVVAGLDLVITVDTSMAHLAGSMGKPVWTLLGPVPEWRWGAAGETTPWYPSMRLFRTEGEAGWAPVIDRIAEALELFVNDRHQSEPLPCRAS